MPFMPNPKFRVFLVIYIGEPDLDKVQPFPVFDFRPVGQAGNAFGLCGDLWVLGSVCPDSPSQ